MKKIIITMLLSLSLGVCAAVPNFCLHNKSGKPVFVQLENGTDVGLQLELGNGNFFEKTIDLSKTTVLDIRLVRNGKVSPSTKFAPNKTIYINWDGKKLYPQKGPKFGLTGKTIKGYSLKNNVKNQKSDIYMIQ